MSFPITYPDVLGAIAGQARSSTGHVQYAVGIFPRQAFINQPIEVLVVLQNMIDKEAAVRVTLNLPDADKKGNPAIMEAAKRQLDLKLKGGEVGVVHIPIVALPPTKAGADYPVGVKVQSKVPRQYAVVRPPDGGPPPSVVSVSPFRIQVFKDVSFAAPVADGSDSVVTFNLAPKRLPSNAEESAATYERLWNVQLLPEEEKLATAQIRDAKRIALSDDSPTAYWALLEQTENRFAEVGMPLHPGEAQAIAKMLAYVVDEVPALERDTYQPEAHRWFGTLCQVLASDEKLQQMPRGELLATYVYDALVYDAIFTAFRLLKDRVNEDLGDDNEQHNFAETVLAFLAGYRQPDLNYVYLPLVMGGVVVNHLVRLDVRQDLAAFLEEVHEAYKGRIRLVSGDAVAVFDILSGLIDQSRRTVTQQQQNPYRR